MYDENVVMKIMKLLDLLTKIAAINILWIGFSMLGLIIFGVFPATVAACQIYRKWKIGEKDVPVFKTFFSTYKKEFLMSNGIGLVLILTGYLLYIDLTFLNQFHHFIAKAAIIIIVSLSIFQMLIIFYIFPMISHYQMTFWNYLKNSFLISISYPIHSLLLIAGFIVILTINSSFPPMIPFFSVSLFLYVAMHIVYDAFSKARHQ